MAIIQKSAGQHHGDVAASTNDEKGFDHGLESWISLLYSCFGDITPFQNHLGDFRFMDEAGVNHWKGKLPTLTSIHVLGAGLKSDRPAHQLFHDIGSLGWRLVPIHPAYAGQEILGRPIRPTLSQGAPPELVVFFLSPKASMNALLTLVRTTPREHMPSLWFQPGAVNEDLMELLEHSAYDFVTETCVVRFIQGHELTPVEPRTEGVWYKQVLSSETQCSIWTVHRTDEPPVGPSDDVFEWCGDGMDLEGSEHVVPRYIRSLRLENETVEALGLRLAAD